MPPLQRRYDVNELAAKDLPSAAIHSMVGGNPLPGDFLINGHLRDGATKRGGHSTAMTRDSVWIDGGDGTQSKLTAITDVIIDTTSISYCYSVQLDANPKVVRDLQPGIITVVVAIEVMSGKVGITWIDKEYKTLEGTERHAEAAPGVQRVSVSVPPMFSETSQAVPQTRRSDWPDSELSLRIRPAIMTKPGNSSPGRSKVREQSRQLSEMKVLPTFISVEATRAEDLAKLAACGYDRFQTVNQYLNPLTKAPYPPREGCSAETQFNHYTSGLFGRELPTENWLEFE